MRLRLALAARRALHRDARVVLALAVTVEQVVVVAVVEPVAVAYMADGTCLSSPAAHWKQDVTTHWADMCKNSMFHSPLSQTSQ